LSAVVYGFSHRAGGAGVVATVLATFVTILFSDTGMS
jgi:hypothetical protein